MKSEGGNGNVNLANVQVSVKNINVEGLVRTKNDAVEKHVRPIFDATNFEEMVKLLHISRSKFEQLGLFKSVQIAIDTDKNSPDGYNITYKVKEQNHFTGGISTLIGTNEGTLVGSLRTPNIFGRGERSSFELTYGSKNSSGFSINFIKPIKADPDLQLQASIFKNQFDLPWSGFKQMDKGFSLDYMFPSRLGYHSLHYEGIWRQLSCINRSTSFAIREESGHNIKSAVKHILQRDTRDSKVLPNIGYLTKFSQEYSGLGGDAHFIKNEFEFQANFPLFWYSTIQLCLAGGILNSLLANNKVCIMDRFFLGGPLTLRGFNLRGAGPHDEDCALGANAYWCSGLHLYTPLPFVPGKGTFGNYFRTHFFFNAGNLGSINKEISLSQNVTSLINLYRLTYGFGIVLRLGNIARLEVNYCVPVRSQIGDSINPGLQFGIGIMFL